MACGFSVVYQDTAERTSSSSPPLYQRQDLGNVRCNVRDISEGCGVPNIQSDMETASTHQSDYEANVRFVMDLPEK